MHLASDLKATFGGAERLVGSFVATAAFLSWLVKVIPLTLGEILSRVIETYRAVVHPIVNALFGWLPFDFPEWWNDAFALYLVIGGAVGRTLWAFYANHSNEADEHFGPLVIGTFKSRPMQVLAVVLSIPLWPLSLIAMVAAPYVMRNPRTKRVFSGSRARYSIWISEQRKLEYVCNLRTVFILQLVAVGILSMAAILSQV